MRLAVAIIAGLASPALAEQVATVRPAKFQHSVDAGLCVAKDHLLSARKAGIDVAFVMARDGRTEMVIAPDAYSRSAILPQLLDFTFEDSMTVRGSARLKNGRFLVELHDGVAETETPLWTALRRHGHTVISLPLRPDDRVGLDLTTMPGVFAQLQDCRKGLTQ